MELTSKTYCINSRTLAMHETIRMKTNTTAAPLYVPLDPSKWQFRILKILPGSFGTMIDCELQLHTTYAAPKYAALSYCWGDEQARRPAVMNDTNITITANLEEALQQLRAIGVGLIWIDALCINQNDNLERSLQVRFMPQIYSKADVTYAWIGNVHLDDAALGLQFLHQIVSGTVQISRRTNKATQRSRRYVKLASQEAGASKFWTARNDSSVDYGSMFKALVDLFNRPYWQRRWVIQELIVSRMTQIICGELMLSLGHMSQALGTCVRQPEWTPRHDTSYRFLKGIFDLRESYYDRQRLALIPTIHRTKDLLSKDKRDKVFALIGVCKDGSELVPTPNYEESLETLNMNLTKELLRRNTSLDMMFIDNEKYNLGDSLPSWCPNWLAPNLPATASTLCQKTSRLSVADSLLTFQDDGPKLFAQGVAFGSVVAISSILSNSPLPTTRTARATKYMHEAQHVQYYGLARAEALSVCLLASSVEPQRLLRKQRCWTCGIDSLDLRLHSVIDVNKGQAPGSTPCWPLLDSWLEDNKDFLIGGRRLQDLASRPLRYYFARFSLPYRRRLRSILVPIYALSIMVLVVVLTLNYLRPGVIPRPVAPVCIVALIVTLCLFWSGPLLFHPYGAKGNNLPKQLLSTARLILLDTGAIALANENTRVGDKLCLIAGCASSVILRGSQGTSGGEVYSVVGQSFVCMSRKDAKKYRAFSEVRMDEAFYVGTWLADEEYKRLIEIYKTYEEWRTFILI